METPLMRTVVIEMSDEAYRALAQEALSVDATLGALLIKGAFLDAMTRRNERGEHDRSHELSRLYTREMERPHRRSFDEAVVDGEMP